MFFASRVNPPQCSPAYAQCRELFLSGHTRKARQVALQLAKSHGPQCAEDYMLCGDISLSALHIHQYYATIKLGLKRFPQHRGLNILWGTILRSRSRIVEAIAFLEDLVERSTGPDKILPNIILASVYAKAGFRRKPLAVFETQHADQEDFYYYQYQKALTALYLRDWHQAVACAERCTQLAPKWLAARELLLEARLSNNDITGGQKELNQMIQARIEDAGVLLKAGFFHYACNHLKHAAQALEHLLNHWENKSLHSVANNLLALIHWRNGNFSEAQKRAAACEPEINELFQKGRPGLESSSRLMLPMPLTAQGHMMCVPVSVMMTAAVQGVKLDADEIYQEAKGWAGTQMWRMSETLIKHGFTTYYVKAEPATVMKLLRMGIPLVGETFGAFYNHVEVIHGFDQGLDIFYLRDPESWIPGHLHMDDLAKRYSTNGGYLYALVSKKNKERLQLAPHEFSAAGEQLFRLQRACALGRVEEAEKVYALLPPIDSILFMAAECAVGVACTEQEKQKVLEMVSKNEDLPPVLRMRALFSMAQFKPPNELLAELNRWKELVGSYMSHLVMLMIDTMDHKWERVVEQADALLQRAYGHEIPWIYKSIALGELGRLKEAREAVDNALDIAPHSLWAREIKNEFSKDHRPYQQRLEEIDELITHLPDDHNLKWIRAGILLDGEDGLRYEEAEKKYIALMPRDKRGYMRLAWWYQSQERTDLINAVIALGNRYLGDQLPKPETEESTPAPSTPESSNHAGAKTEAAETEHVKTAPPPDDAKESDDPAVKLLAEVERQCNESKSGQHPDQLEAVPRAMALLYDGELLWHQVAQLLFYRIITVYRNFNSGEAAEELKRILPPKPAILPGPPFLGLTGLLENLDVLNLAHEEAAVLREWAGGQIPANASAPPELTLQMAHFKQLRGHLNEAENIYADLAEKHPNMIDAHFYVGEIAYIKERLRLALEKSEAVLELEPSHYETLIRLTGVCGALNMPDRQLYWHERGWRKYPYSYYQTLNYLSKTAVIKGHKEAEKIRESVAHFHEPLRQALLNFHVKSFYYYTSDIKELLNSPPLKESKHPAVLEANLELYHNIGAYADLKKAAAKALETEPGNLEFMAHYGAALARLNPDAALEYYRSCLQKGFFHKSILDGFLNLSESDLLSTGGQLMDEAPEQYRESILEILSQTALQWHNLKEARAYLEWVLQQAPHLPQVRLNAAIFYNETGEFMKSYQTLQPLLSQYPDDPEYLLWAARATRSSTPQDALLFMERAYRLNDGIAFALELAKVYQLLSQNDKARKVYQQVLRNAPYEGVAIVDLIALGEPAGDFLDDLFIVVSQKESATVPNLHLITLQTAIRHNKTIPLHWIDTARSRFETIKNFKPYADEQLRLGLAIAHWFKEKEEPDAERYYRKHCGKMLDKIKLRNLWTRDHWVPWG